MTISVDSENKSDKIQHSVTIRTLNKLDNGGKYLNTIKAINDKPTVNPILNELFL
jgi:hypothetical protein